MKCNCNCKMCWNCVKPIFKTLLVTLLIIVNIFLCLSMCTEEEEPPIGEESYSGAIIPFSSTASTGISLTTNADGTPLNMALLSFGYGQNISATIGNNNMDTLNFNLQEYPWETSFVMPRDGEITAISFSFTNAVNTNTYDFDTRIIVKLYAAPANSEVFNALTEATFELDQVLNGNLAGNAVITGSNKDLSIPVEEDTKLLLAVYLSSDNPNNDQTVELIGGAHAGINIR